jgi:two-component system copper resistance phosphate regulon response regulator CusR
VPKARKRSVWLSRPEPPACSRPVRRPRSDRDQGPPCSPKSLLWIDDYQPFLDLYKSIFETLGYHVLIASRGSVGLALAASNQVDAVVLDYEMPEMNGEAVAIELKNRHPHIPIVMCSGSPQLPERVRDLVDATCDKAGSRDHLLSAIEAVIQNRQNFRSATPVYAA